MGAIKRTPADQAMSKCVRMRSAYRCERCGAQHNASSPGLHASHHFSRGNWSVRFDPKNLESMCYGCHSHYGGTEERMREVMTEHELDLLREKKHDTGLGKLYRKTKGKGEIAKHFRDELARMEALRDHGDTGRIEFEGWL